MDEEPGAVFSADERLHPKQLSRPRVARPDAVKRRNLALGKGRSLGGLAARAWASSLSRPGRAVGREFGEHALHLCVGKQVRWPELQCAPVLLAERLDFDRE